MSTLAPIILFVFNRPWHTQQVLEALSQNVLADQSMLYIYSDGPKVDAPENTLSHIEVVRNIIRQKQWCKEVIIKERDHNLGLANSVIQGVTEVLEIHGKVIVLEDDIITGKYFLQFMNDGLEMYKDEPKVFGISGYKYPSIKEVKESTHFLPISSSWSYAVWKNTWQEVNFNSEELLKEVDNKKIAAKMNFGDYPFYELLKSQVAGKIDSWAIRFYASLFLKGGLFLYPSISLVQNVGFDETGTHCKNENYFSTVNLNMNKIEIRKLSISLNKRTVQFFEKSFMLKQRKENKKTIPLIKKTYRRLRRVIKKLSNKE